MRVSRQHSLYLRVSVTDRCNLRCFYCSPMKTRKGAPKEEILRYEEIVELVNAFIHFGVRKVRITGGEPLVRPNIDFLLTELNSLSSVPSLGLTTNGIRLDHFVTVLAKTRFKVNCHIDTLDSVKYSQIMGGADITRVVDSLKALVDCGVPVKINSVVTKETTYDDCDSLVAFGALHKIPVRFIEMMPASKSIVEETSPSHIETLKRQLIERWALYPVGRDGVASMFKGLGSEALVGFIMPSDSHFCDNCLRFRLSARGMLRTCLYSRDGVDLRAVLREGDQKRLFEAIEIAIARKCLGFGREGKIIEAMWEIGG
jgi:cyclic pyranopterin phosphate synthase